MTVWWSLIIDITWIKIWIFFSWISVWLFQTFILETCSSVFAHFYFHSYSLGQAVYTPEVRWFDVICTRIAHWPYYYFICSIRCWDYTFGEFALLSLVQICTLIENTCPCTMRHQAKSASNNYFIEIRRVLLNEMFENITRVPISLDVILAIALATVNYIIYYYIIYWNNMF